MQAYIALLRAVNVGGRNRVPMAELKQMATSIGFEDGRTWLQSGNLVFRGVSRTTTELETLLEEETEQRFGVRPDYMVRTREEWESAIRANPFPEMAVEDPSHLLVHFMKSAPDLGAIDTLRAATKGRETAECRGTELYLCYPDGIGESKLTNAVIESRLKTKGTARNWNTVLKLAELALS